MVTPGSVLFWQLVYSGLYTGTRTSASLTICWNVCGWMVGGVSDIDQPCNCSVSVIWLASWLATSRYWMVAMAACPLDGSTSTETESTSTRGSHCCSARVTSSSIDF